MRAELLNKKNIVIFAVTASLLLTAALTTAYAKYRKGSEAVENTFSAAEYGEPSISDNVEKNGSGHFVKNNLAVIAADEGYPVYVRAELVVTWQNADGIVYGSQPVPGTDYALEYDTDKWVKASDGFFYYTEKVESGSHTAPLIGAQQALEQLSSAPVGYTMHVEVISETIQAVGNTDDDSASAVLSAWGVQPDQLAEGGQP